MTHIPQRIKKPAATEIRNWGGLSAADDPIIGQAVLTRRQVCRWLQISERQFFRLNVPAIRVGKRGVRYHAGTVIEYLNGERVA